MNTICGFDICEGYSKNDQLYRGAISRSKLNHKFELFQFTLNAYNPFHLDFNSKIDLSVYLCINMDYKSSLSFTYHECLRSVSPFSCILIPCKNAVNLSFLIEPNQNYNFLLMKIAQPVLKLGKTTLVKQFEDLSLIEREVYLTSMPNLLLCETVKKLCALNTQKVENKLIAVGYCNIILGLKLKEKENYQRAISISSFFRSYEIKELECIEEAIERHPERPYSIKDLCQQTGLSVIKLQAGFKVRHNCTVAIFIRNARLKKAIKLIQTTDLNVSEIVYSVGFNSRSYFCRIFKKRFKCSPKIYQQMFRNRNSSA